MAWGRHQRIMWYPGFKEPYVYCTYVHCFVVPTKILFCFDVLPWEHLTIREGRMCLYMWPWHYPKPRAHKFSKNPGLSSKFRVSEGWFDERSILTTRVMLEPLSYVVISVWCLWTDNILWCKGRDAIITLKMLGTTIQNAFNYVVRHLRFVYFCPHLFLQNWNYASNGLEPGRACENTGVCRIE